MSTSPVFARAKPRTVTIEELYHYQGEISRNTYIDLTSNSAGNVHLPEGLITVELPYDGHRWLDERARQDIDAGHHAGLDEHQAVVAYLAFDQTAHTDLARRLALDPLTTAWPLVLPLRGDTREELTDLIARDAVCRIRQAYRIDPAVIEIIPVQVSIGLTEEVDILAANRGGRSGRTLEARPGFEPDLALAIDLKVILPHDLGCQEVFLEQAAVRWPVTTVPRLLKVQTEESQPREALRSVQFDPEGRQVIWRALPLRRITHPAGPSEYDRFETAGLRLWIYRPTDLYDTHRLDATFELLLCGVLLSGLQIRPFEATGKPANWPRRSLHDPDMSDETTLHIGTRLRVDLAIWLEDIFHEKTYTPRRHLVFDGVIPTPERVEDITALLQDLGFENIDTLHDERGPDGNVRWLALEARRTERARQMDVRVIFQGETARTEAATYIRGGRSYTTEQMTGRSVLDIIVRQAADHVTLTETLNDLQVKLKERFLHVAEVK